MVDDNYVRLGSVCHCVERGKRLKCAHCGSEFISGDKRAMYCAKKCKLAAWKVRHGYTRKTAKATDSQKAIKSLANAIKQVAKAKRYAASLIAKKKREEATKNTHKPCVVCGGDCRYVFGRAKKYCSAKCRKQSPDFKAQKKIERKKRGTGHVQRAKKLGCAYKHFNVLKVFERDKWTCQLCGIKTPKKLKGSIDPRAPELDHILALALGGGHVIENCQCSCRKCNNEKGSGSSGQMWLDGCA